VYNTLSEVAAAIHLLARTPATVSALTGSRRRSLTDAELRELGRNLRAVRLHPDQATPEAAVTSVHDRRVLRR
jgi:hypothetical protein